jgi:hypothetical protein
MLVPLYPVGAACLTPSAINHGNKIFWRSARDHNPIFFDAFLIMTDTLIEGKLIPTSP